jgi:hypothetical protein
MLPLDAASQATPTQAAEDEVRHVLDNYYKAVRAGGPGRLEFLSRDARFFSPGGASLGRAFLAGWAGPGQKTRSILVRHIHFPRPDVALAIAIWHDARAQPPFDAGMLDFTLVQEDGKWNIATQRQGYLPSPGSVSVPAGTVRSDDGLISAEDRAAGWESLFDGKTSGGWFSVSGSKDLPPSWRIEDGCLVTVAGKTPMALRTQREFTSYQLEFEWKVSAGGNSGVKYRLYAVALSPDGQFGDGEGYEFQLADDDGDAGAKVDPKQRSGSLYGVTPVNTSAAKPVGEWNQSRLIVTGDHVEHWLNGVQTARQDIDVAFGSPILLQHHNREVRFRAIRIRPLN